MPKYQGRELTSTLQAPSKSSLNSLIGDARKYAKASGMDSFKILESGRDPDGGYRAIVTAHNWNPISWIKEKIGKKKKPIEENPGEGFTSIDTEVISEDPGKVRSEEKKAWESFERESRKQEEVAKIKKEYELKRAKRLRELGDVGRKEAQEEAIQQQVAGIATEHRRAATKEIREGLREREQAAIEIVSEGIPEEIVTKQKVLQKEYWTKKGTEEPVPEPRTAQERAESDYHPSQWTYVDVKRKLSAPERASLARAIQFEKMELDITKEKYKQFKRERSTPYRVAKAAGGFGTFMAGAMTMGVAGMARGSRPGKGGPERAMRMHAPGVPMDLYAVRPMLGVGMPSSRDLTGSGLSHLRALTFPGIRKSKKQVQQVRRSVEQER